ncbi:hypothetical protein [Pseudonocardia xishanensis]|uniref:Sporulation protein YjcZ n=1 Tax=Pseudonocardia xishanensis TaxID=630995 RepID=A0ABP8RPX7_9PSEU
MADRHAPFGYNARDPWAQHLFTGEPPAAEGSAGGTGALVVLAVLFALIGGAAYLYSALALF